MSVDADDAQTLNLFKNQVIVQLCAFSLSDILLILIIGNNPLSLPPILNKLF